VAVDVPPRISFVTLGARDLPALRRFYRGLGWVEAAGASDGFTSFDCGGVRLALYPVELLRAEAAPDAPVPDPAVWNGITLAVNVASRADVDAVFARALACGATPVAPPTDRDWGGCSAYVADPEGNRWELAWAPGLDP
jgi:catechol 2,3-dioxygenase-like lactoylglutathione lyase family enzyme